MVSSKINELSPYVMVLFSCQNTWVLEGEGHRIDFIIVTRCMHSYALYSVAHLLVHDPSCSLTISSEQLKLFFVLWELICYRRGCSHDAQSETEPSHHFHSDEHNSIRKQDAGWGERGEEGQPWRHVSLRVVGTMTLSSSSVGRCYISQSESWELKGIKFVILWNGYE